MIDTVIKRIHSMQKLLSLSLSLSLYNKKIYLRTHSDLHVNLLNLQIDPGRQTLVGHWSLHGIAIKIKNNLKTVFTYYTICHIYNTLRSHKLVRLSSESYVKEQLAKKQVMQIKNINKNIKKLEIF